MTRRRRRRLGGVALAIAGVCAVALQAGAEPAVPVPGPLVKVRTESGGVVRERVIPLGGVPVPMDVDERAVTGVLTPDVDVSVGVVAAEELPGRPLVPTLQVRRSALAIARGTAAPPLRIDVTLDINDAARLMRRIATVTYGYETPAGGLAPSVFRTKLVGPPSGGFVDPLVALVETPGYSGPLTINAHVLSDKNDDDFVVSLDPLPERIRVVADERDDGLDFAYEHGGPIPDVRLATTADLLDRTDGRRRHIEARVDRVPQRIDIAHTSTKERMFVEYEAVSPAGAPDLEVDYRDTLASGAVVADAAVKVGGLPARMTGEAFFTPRTDGGADLVSARFSALDGGEIDALDFLVRNYVGAPGPVPEPVLGAEQLITAATRQMPDRTARFRVTGRARGVRAVRLARTGAARDGIELTSDVGDGVRPLQALVDLDNRGPGGPADPADRRRLVLDTTIAPLPRKIDIDYDLAGRGQPARVVYDADLNADVTADVRIAEADTTDDCGEADVTCLASAIEGLPAHFELDLPGEGGTDFRLSHNGATKPDVRAVVDRTPADPAQRTWADVRLDGVPKEVRGRLDAKGDVVRAAEFHGCASITTATCPSSPGVIDRVGFTVREEPARTGLPPRADVAQQFVALVKRDARFEVTGRVDDVHRVAFRQRDADKDGRADGTLGALVAAGAGKPFRATVDQLDTLRTPRGILGTRRADVDVRVDALPGSFATCVRQPDATRAPPDPATLPADALLAECDRVDVLGRGATQPLTVTPLSAAYRADARTKVDARIEMSEPDLGDRNLLGTPVPRTTRVVTGVDSIPAGVTRLDAITPDVAAGRKLELAYSAPATISAIDFALESRRSSSLCEDPRPNRKATCVSGRLEDLPGTVTATFDPNPATGDIDVSAPAAGGGRLSISADTSRPPFRLSHVAPDDPTTTGKDESSRLVLDARIREISDHLVARLQQLDDPADASPDPTLAAVRFDACPDGGTCAGISSIDFTATTGAAGDPFAGFPVPAPPAGVGQRFHFLQRGDELRAHGRVEDLRELTYSRLSADGTFSRATSLHAGFGAGKALHAYVDRDTGGEAQVIDAVLRDTAQTVGVCLRGEVLPAEVKTGAGASFCERADARKLAVQAQLPSPAASVRPDIELRRLELARGGGTQVVAGSASVSDLAERIDVLVGAGPPECADGVDNDGDGLTDQGVAAPGPPLVPGDPDCSAAGDDAENPAGIAVAEPPEVLVEGRDGAGALAPAARRVGFDLATTRAPSGGGFPWAPLDATTVEPEQDPDNLDGTAHNFFKLVKDGDVVRATGSVPEVRRVALAPQPCHASDPRFPPLSRFTDAARRPEFLCANVVAAQGRPLGFAVRTREPGDRVLAIDDGHVSDIPAGDGGLMVTLVKVPEAIRLSPVCRTPADAVAPDFCRPPLLSVQAKKAGAQAPRLRGRLAIGLLDLVREVRDLRPADDLSQRLDYEQRPRDYPQLGARVKLGKRGDQIALRAGMKLALPNFLDLDPPTSYRCARLIGQPGCDQDARTPQWGEDHNRGLEAIDVFFKLVAADSQPGGSDVATLGRTALLFHDFAPSGTQVVLTGAPDAEAQNHGADPPVPTGGSSHTPENPPSPGDHDLGALVPGHLDTEVYLRNDFDAPFAGTTQQRFIQVDGRVNAPLTMAVRLNRPRCFTGVTLPGFTLPGACLPAGGARRSGGAVPAAQFTVRNAPGLGSGVTDYTRPTFRARAEIRSGRRGGPFGLCIKVLVGCVYAPDSGDHSGRVNPPPDVSWLDVQLNLRPKPTGEPARTVEAVVDPVQRTADVDMRGFTDVYASPTPLGARGRAGFTAQAGMRLTPFNIYVRFGLDDTWTRLFGDLVLHGATDANRRLRLSQNAGRSLIAPEGGDALLNVNLREVIEDDPAIGQTIRRDLGRVPVHFSQCSGSGISTNGFATTSAQDRGLTLPVSVIPAPILLRRPLIAPALVLLPGMWCTGSFAGLPVGPFGVDQSDLIGSAPAPRFVEPGRPVPGAPTVANTSTPPPATPRQTTADPVTVSGPETRCGSLTATTLLVTGSGRIDVGAPGTSITEVIDGHPVTIPCDGTLIVDADSVKIEPGGEILADGLVAGGDGRPLRGVGGGAGHLHRGGTSGRGDPGGLDYGASDTIDVPKDLGSQGGDGAGGARGGLGGGLVVIRAREWIEVHGQVSARGAGGDPASGLGCGQTAAGGGSGGAIHLDAPLVEVTGAVLADGGRGGAGAHGGGGGAGGKVAIDTTGRQTPGAVTAAAGQGGPGEPGCATGVNGGAGDAGLGTTLSRFGQVERAGASGPFITSRTVSLTFRGHQPAGGDLQFVFCRRSVGTSTSDPFETAALDPLGGAVTSTTTPSDLLGDRDTTCASVGGTPGAGAIYTATTTDAPPPDDYHGYHAFAAQPSTPGVDCADPATGALTLCAYQEVLPRRAALRFGLDTKPPSLTVSRVSGDPGCPGSSNCLTAPRGELTLVTTDAMSGPTALRCGVNRTSPSDPFPLPCGPGRAAIPLGAGDGLKTLDVRVEDVAGNSGPFTAQARWFVDTKPPNAPVLTLTHPGTARNGWFRTKPTLEVDVDDPAPSSGWRTDPIAVAVDGAEARCGGTPAAPGVNAAASARCTTAQTAAIVPADGVHVFTARATDRLGNTSPDSARVTMRVDSTPPRSRLFLAPTTADGDNGWYRTTPRLAFGASDGAGGSGVDLRRTPPPGATENLVRYQVDGGSFQDWDPRADITVDEGVHELCWYAIDLAGNREADGDPRTNARATNCRTIKVDATAPAAVAGVTPAAPDGAGGFYRSRPTVDPQGSDPVPAGVPASDVSKLDRVEYQLDEDGWRSAAAFTVPDGDHHVRVRAFDKAGNAAAIADLPLRVDSAAPTASILTHPPAPNAQGFFGRVQTVAVAALDARPGSGAERATLAVNGAPAVPYAGPVAIGHGSHALEARATDRAGLTSGPSTSRPNIDVLAPVPRVGTPAPAPILAAGQTTTLRFDVDGTPAPRVRVLVQVLNALGDVVAAVAAPGSHPGGFRDAGPGQVTWNGADALGRPVAPGLYHYRVQAIDQAGNAAISTESRSFAVQAAP